MASAAVGRGLTTRTSRSLASPHLGTACAAGPAPRCRGRERPSVIESKSSRCARGARVVVTSSQSLLQSSNRLGNSCRVMAPRGCQIAHLDKSADQLVRTCFEGRLVDVTHGDGVWFGQIGLPTKSSKTIDSWTGSYRSPAGLTGYRRNRGDLLLESVRQDHLAPEQSKRIGARPSLDSSRNSSDPVLLYYHQTYFRQHRRELTLWNKK
jgi:hypothetical protein